MGKLTATVFATVCLITSSAKATTSSDLKNYFNNLGFATNVTGAHAYKTQAAGYLSTGGVYLRNQVRNIQIMHVDTPGWRSGCGNIDIIAGGFSFISSAQITQFMQSILSSGAGYALNLALETELPEIAHSLQFMQKLANDINSSNMNSCEMGETLAGGLLSKNVKAHRDICEDLGMKDNIFSDWAKARQACTTGGEIDSQLERAKADPAYKDKVLYNTNIVWDSLLKNQFLSNDEKLAEAYMSISGTIVFDKDGTISSYPSLARNRDFIKAMLYGGKLPTYVCKDNGKQSQCIDVEFTESKYQTIAENDALVAKVQVLFKGIYDNIVNDSPLTDEQNGIIGMTQSSVFQLIASNAELRTGIQGSYVLAESVASDILAQYLSNSLDIIRSSTAGREIGVGNDDRLFKGIAQAQLAVDEFAKESRAKLNQVLMTNQLIENNIKKGLSALPAMLRVAYQGEGQA